MSTCVIPTEVWQRFWAKVNRNGPTQPHMSTPCWVWTASKDRDGYGNFKFQGQLRRAHRFAFGLGTSGQVLHHCDNRACVRQDHLYEGTNEQNMQDRARRGRTAAGDRNGARRHPERLRRGSSVSTSKLTEEQVRLIRELHRQGALQQDLATRFGVVNQLVSAIVHRKAWAHLP
jgi:hypothetical protein